MTRPVKGRESVTGAFLGVCARGRGLLSPSLLSRSVSCLSPGAQGLIRLDMLMPPVTPNCTNKSVTFVGTSLVPLVLGKLGKLCPFGHNTWKSQCLSLELLLWSGPHCHRRDSPCFCGAAGTGAKTAGGQRVRGPSGSWAGRPRLRLSSERTRAGTLAKLPGFGRGWTGTARDCRLSPTPKPSPWPRSSRLCCPIPRSSEPGRLRPTRGKCGGDGPFTASDREQTSRGSFRSLLPHLDRIPLLP